ncbi:DMT family transporter [Clostridium cylindrosporum]|uniref:Multidrug resistance protein YkkD n=1 Tax=Clostridium cylindrosporum DSM 605 TaxID=1121307 RepID=A0A0J8DCE1_CLOCY|nr:multidrug efflux SMR transporter [Clostridium cylindrosporum]KMT21974.1 multidrug resistance protein YkkD [Clostridium cylindrosporum DSM 605]
MAWASIIVAGLCEILGVAMINKFQQTRKILFLIMVMLSFISGFILLSYSMKSIPMGTAYAVWTGIGTSGSAILGMIFFGESRDWKRILFILMVLSSAVGLKLLV